MRLLHFLLYFWSSHPAEDLGVGVLHEVRHLVEETAVVPLEREERGDPWVLHRQHVEDDVQRRRPYLTEAHGDSSVRKYVSGRGTV